MPAVLTESVAIPIGGGQRIEADLVVPDAATGVIVFAHGSGSSRFSSRNRIVAKSLHERRLGTLLLDLLTRDEESVEVYTAEYRFDIERLGRRVTLATDWIESRREVRSLPIGYFGASTGAAAALIAAADRPTRVRAVVSRGGRPDLAGPALTKVTSPTLLIVGELDDAVIEMNRDALSRMGEVRILELKLVPGATHLFEEPGTLEQVQRLAGEWFERHLTPRRST